MKNSGLIVSLDFELHWGAVEKWDTQETSEKIERTRKAIYEILELFNSYEIHATWATVGFLFAKSREELEDTLPNLRPEYTDKKISTYEIFDQNQIGSSELDDRSHYAASIVDKIKGSPNQEVASHTYSHYYTLEDGQNIECFEDDIDSACKISKLRGVQLRSLVFPRNQFNKSYLPVLKRYGFKCVRSNPNTWVWSNRIIGKGAVSKKIRKLVRGLDLLIPISRNHFSYQANQLKSENDLVCIPASRFLRPYSRSEGMLNKLKMWRIKGEMTSAAKNNNLYHLWWHPHNFSEDMENNMRYLTEILEHYAMLKSRYSFGSFTMAEVSDLVSYRGEF